MKCDHCKKPIGDNEEYYCVSVNKEKFMGEEIEVYSSKMILTFCANCATKYDFERISVPTA